MEITIDTTGARDPRKKEVRMIINSPDFRSAIVMTPTFAQMIGATLLQAASDIQMGDALGKVYTSSLEVVKPAR